MNIYLSKCGHSLKLTLKGRMDRETVFENRYHFSELATTDSNAVTLHLNDVTYMDEAGVGTLVSLARQLQLRDVRLTINGLHGQPENLMKVLGLDVIINDAIAA